MCPKQSKNKPQSKTKPQINLTEQTKYPGGLNFSDFKELKEIESSNNNKNSMYLLFDPSLIKDFEEISTDDLKAFERIVAFPQTCAKEGQPGIKYFDGKNKPECKVAGEDKPYEITHELKIKSSENRIVLFTLKPINNGPTILVAAQYIKGGLHHSKVSQKTFTGTLPSSPKNNHYTFFKPSTEADKKSFAIKTSTPVFSR